MRPESYALRPQHGSPARNTFNRSMVLKNLRTEAAEAAPDELISRVGSRPRR